MERSFIPTGLSTGRTLKAVDIVGRNRSTGKRIMAQCKKNSNPVSIEEGFIESLGPNDEAYYFAYGGCTDTHASIIIIDRSYVHKWINTPNGNLFKDLFLGGGS